MKPMTNGKKPFDDADSERTVIKPNPGGRRDSGVEPQSPLSQPASPQQSNDFWGGTRQPPGSATVRHTAQPQPVPVASPPLQQGSVSVDLSNFNAIQVKGSNNPILEAAMPLLILLANVRIARAVPQVGPMMNTVAQGIETFEASLQAQNIAETQVRTAKYAICATADDIVQNLPSSDRLLWTQYSMLSRYFQTRDSGIGFFDELTKLRQNPQINHNLLGLMHACMSLGFEGRYRVNGGDVAHQQIRRDIYQTMRSREARTSAELSPHWRGQDIAAAYVRRAVPLWAVASSAAGLLLLSFIVFRWLLGGMSDAADMKLAALHPNGDVNIFRVKPAPPPPPSEIPNSTQLQRIREKLKDEITAKKLSAAYAGSEIVIRLLNDSVFDSASASVRQGFVNSIRKIAGTLEAEKGKIRVIGHTDKTPIKGSVKFKDNQDLSEKRAQAVALLLVSGVSDPRRIETHGLADTAPIDKANTPAARARNRRVEIFIPREDAP